MSYPQCRLSAEVHDNGVVLQRICFNCRSPHRGTLVHPHECNICQRPAACVPEQPRPDQPEQKPPPITRRLLTWSEACAKWVEAGSPVRLQDEIDRIYKYFCKPCSFRMRSKNICLVCGCRVDVFGYAVFNKIKMATEHCPKGKW
jgi:hypothetical protein